MCKEKLLIISIFIEFPERRRKLRLTEEDKVREFT